MREEFRRAAHNMIDLAFDHWEKLDKKPPWRPLERRTQAFFNSALPETPTSPDDLVQALRTQGLLNPSVHAHPKFFGWVIGSGHFEGLLGRLAETLTNTNAFGGAQVSTLVEKQVLSWTQEALSLPLHTNGVCLSGSSEANLLGLAAARFHTLGPCTDGLPLSSPRPRILASRACHHSIHRASCLLGLGKPIEVETNSSDVMSTIALDRALHASWARGEKPIAIAATAGTAALGSFDPLESISQLCTSHNLWLHVDGAFGAWAAATTRLQHKTRGLDEADSIALDYHKALHAPHTCGALLLRTPHRLEQIFAASSDYLIPFRGGLGGLRDWPGSKSLSTSRSFASLGVWTTFKGLGMDQLRQEIEASYARANELAKLINSETHWSLEHTPQGPVVVFRATPRDNRRTLSTITRLQQDGYAVITPVRRPDGPAFRVSTLGHRTLQQDLEDLVCTVAATYEKCA